MRHGVEAGKGWQGLSFIQCRRHHRPPEAPSRQVGILIRFHVGVWRTNLRRARLGVGAERGAERGQVR